jgi:hypothetical protein
MGEDVASCQQLVEGLARPTSTAWLLRVQKVEGMAHDWRTPAVWKVVGRMSGHPLISGNGRMGRQTTVVFTQAQIS